MMIEPHALEARIHNLQILQLGWNQTIASEFKTVLQPWQSGCITKLVFLHATPAGVVVRQAMVPPALNVESQQVTAIDV
jgi:hypothetical protein